MIHIMLKHIYTYFTFIEENLGHKSVLIATSSATFQSTNACETGGTEEREINFRHAIASLKTPHKAS